MTGLEIRERGGEIIFTVRVQPRASREAVDGVREGALRVRLTAPPVEGEANEALVRFLAARLQAPKSAVRILSGERGRVKRIAVRGVTVAAVESLAARADT
jgi:uncharacterized protein (TIGR00251 family)